VSERLARLAAVLAEAGLRPRADPISKTSHSNDAWELDDELLGPVVLRICWLGDTDRLLREGAVAQLIPAAVRYPRVIGFGRVTGDRDLTWTVTRRLAGVSLLEAWPGLSDAVRRRACREVADMVRALHSWRPPQRLSRRLIPSEADPSQGAAGVIGRSIIPLPLPSVMTLLQHAEVATDWDAALLARVRAFFESTPPDWIPVFDQPGRSGIVHSDLHLSNIWWEESGSAALLDLEWVRLAPPCVELARLKDNVDADEVEGLTAHRVLFENLRVDYPELFAVPTQAQQITVCQVAHHVRQLILSPADAGAAELPKDHPRLLLEALLPA
jgi:aminoglycoside phosphotransferase (APT) family kinase protein